MTPNTSRLCKGYLTKESDGVLRQMTWPPQSPDLNPIEMVWDELDRKVKAKGPTSAKHLCERCWREDMNGRFSTNYGQETRDAQCTRAALVLLL
ncbi:unnamed protein product [Ranitomeya imitator]|uniref:Tc1-like transposase DDE domain-containing protein n=1 Tax=Ranitomeya imitator TaxID=111125 RepID=A0ABN9LZ26_9NEOB|nr:unnamed protein product [Ranitomeya imitator]